MDRRQLTYGSRGTWRLLSATIVALVVMLALEADPTAAASRCRVTNGDSGLAYPRLQQAVDAAKPGNWLVVEGTCHGGTFIDRDLAIKGVTTRRTGKAVLDGDGKARVMTIKPNVNVNIRDLVIRDGKATRIPDGGGISSKGRLTLTDVVVRNSAALRGGGIYNEGILRIRGRSVVSSNSGVTSGVHNVGRLVLGGRTSVRSNIGGEAVSNSGFLLLRGSSDISANDDGRRGARVLNYGTILMTGASSISEQGAVSNPGTLTMNGSSSIHHNVAVGYMCGIDTGIGYGGGVSNTGTLTMNDSSSIPHNLAGGDCYDRIGRGGGVFNASGSLTMSGSSRIYENEAMTAANGPPGRGGGIYDKNGTLTGVSCGSQTGANVVANTPDDCFIESP